MARNRYLPFGYRLENGEIVICSSEAECIERAYTAYADGASYASIAETMQASGVRYHPDTPLWNKHMVKRMLENERYTDIGGYPAIIQTKLFEQVAVIRAGKAVKRKKTEKLPVPTLPPTPPVVPNRLTDISIARLENQINQELSKPVLEPERLQDMIFQLAVKKYDVIRTYNSIQSNQVDASSVHFDI